MPYKFHIFYTFSTSNATAIAQALDTKLCILHLCYLFQFSLPAPKGGKYATNPILVEDQKEAQQRASKASRMKYNAFDNDYFSHNSPFAPIDTQSRAAQLGFNRFGKKSRGRTQKGSGRRG